MKYKWKIGTLIWHGKPDINWDVEFRGVIIVFNPTRANLHWNRYKCCSVLGYAFRPLDNPDWPSPSHSQGVISPEQWETSSLPLEIDMQGRLSHLTDVLTRCNVCWRVPQRQLPLVPSHKWVMARDQFCKCRFISIIFRTPEENQMWPPINWSIETVWRFSLWCCHTKALMVLSPEIRLHQQVMTAQHRFLPVHAAASAT